MTMISIAWNNLTPFFKVGGEPVKYFMLSKHIPKRFALASTINYNIIHVLATFAAFIISAFLIPFFFNVTSVVALSCFIFAFIGFVVLLWWHPGGMPVFVCCGKVYAGSLSIVG